ncbi:mannose-1-phosphate guanylyltransferase/mannose-6-phosphate isomerase [Halorhodospira halophila]|uniref:mannose-1-phosphate guanylyltransferase n=1 Tax=Halorhodospira halophila (strain DSM 244 / SL1) TaxID=349124 RepID=A1WX93_HALHL|nr:mannose-1-phosphate guanylyltransferase/mannose-6-phosphate isomerase [Halorhodospira halophila]ABM62305.1 mannose-6-phosphate isomerase, type 2 / mannose-1-phosphate guanylyltransferase (GDP) [Halorhodospira halophila SL1]MBK1729280.1 mannose-1-phosphate guanylyltransferase/mannose-6-phosphate isomerase [Halorhodospira halophila]
MADDAYTPSQAAPDSQDVFERAARRHAVILAGGSGTRLWPLSRRNMPKQLLALTSADTLLQETAARLLPALPAQRMSTVTHVDHRFEVKGQLHEVDPQLAEGVLVEPSARNTLPAIAWAVARIAHERPDALVGVFPSDHQIADAEALRGAWARAEVAADAGKLVLFGIQPTEPATGFGYIQAGPALEVGVEQVQRFVEKPDGQTAQRYLEQGGYYWNSGMFVFRADRFLELLAAHQPEIADAVAEWAEPDCPPDSDRYGQLPELSIDYGLLERADSVAVVPVDLGWSDLGSWEALYQERIKDDHGNVCQGPALPVDSQDNLLWSADGGLLAAYGVENLALVQTRDATLVCPRDRLGDLKPLVAEVAAYKPELAEYHVTVARPWGSYTTLESGHRYKLKRIVVKPGCQLSLQMHYHRSEHWVVIAGTAKVVNGDEEIYLEENQSTYVPATRPHRLSNPGRIPLQIIEIQTGPYLEEDDLVRFEDLYGRMDDASESR